MKNIIPITLFGKDYWNKVINFEYLSDMGLIEENYLSIFQYTDNAQEASDLIRKSSGNTH